MASNSLKDLKKKALELIRMGDKVYHYRRDVLPAADVTALKDNTIQLEALYKDKASDPEKIQEHMDAQEAILAKTGGTFWNNRFWSEQVETIMVVAIVIIAFRIFFFQPFVIPTSSMYPTYSGMQSTTYELGESSPNLFKKAALKILRGGSHYSVEAQNSGEIQIPIGPNGQYYYRPIKGRKWFILPATKKEYIIFVGSNPHSIVVPAEFDLQEVLGKTYNLLGTLRYHGETIKGMPVIPTGKTVKKGEKALQFDILMGDALFVNRFWYHFAKPKSGDAIVFRTEDFMDRKSVGDLRIPKSHRVGEDKFYIKRLVGEEGQELKVVDFRLFQDGEPATGADAFEHNALQDGEYPGYRNVSILSQGSSYTVPENHVFAMGDNSANSKDSRYFGPVPDKEVIGCASFIYYPFTKRWGLAK